jgi:hypothetical protein
MSRFARCQFGEISRTYTYDTNGHEVAVGDSVLVPTPRGDTAIVKVVELTDEEPPFETRPIVGKHIQIEEEN